MTFAVMGLIELVIMLTLLARDRICRLFYGGASSRIEQPPKFAFWLNESGWIGHFVGCGGKNLSQGGLFAGSCDHEDDAPGAVD